jgi:hypothetical protein
VIGDNEDKFESFFELCFLSKNWMKWFPDGFDAQGNKEKIVLVSGHYVFSDPTFKKLIADFDGLGDVIAEALGNKITSLINI